MAITDWPEGERPRERLLQQGAESLSDAELLAIFLRTGIRGKSAVDLGRDILSRFGSLNQIFHATATECIAVPGLGIAKYTQLQAILEMAKRALSEQLSLRELMTSPQTVRDYLRLSLGNLPHEVFLALWLDAQNRLILSEELFRGTLTQASVYPREVVKRALHHNAAAVIFAHNHPSGFTEASAADKTLTQALKNALKLIDVKLLDHFIIVNGKAPSSMAEQGLIG